jgi:hypothetical protein
MRLLTEIDPKPAPLPDHIEWGIQIAGKKMEDARRMQNAAALNSESVRMMLGIDEPRVPLNGYYSSWLMATERHAAEQYAYARYLMGIDDYWLSIPHMTTKLRFEYTL